MLPVSVQVSRPDVPGSKGSTYAHRVSSKFLFFLQIPHLNCLCRVFFFSFCCYMNCLNVDPFFMLTVETRDVTRQRRQHPRGDFALFLALPAVDTKSERLGYSKRLQSFLFVAQPVGWPVSGRRRPIYSLTRSLGAGHCNFGEPKF